MTSEANGKTIRFEDCAFSPKRKKLAENLTEYLQLQKNGYVLNVDGEWGSGKTFFLKAWEDMLKDEHPTCYIDAWTLDYLNDPLATLSRRILEAIHEHLQSVGLLNPALEKRVFEGLYKVLSTGAHIAGAVIENTTTPAIGKAIQFGITKLDNKLLKSGKEQYELFKKSEDALIQFRTILQQYINHAIEKSPETSPFFILIDELDRCRPNYAIELLESVKHLFCLRNTVFIIATNRSEMEKSIQKVYGDGFKSDNYLSRFFDRSISIRAPSKEIYLKNNEKLKNIVDSILEETYTRPIIDPVKFLGAAFKFHEIELREIDKILDQLSFLIPSLSNKRFSFYALLYLFIIKEAYRDGFHHLYPKIEKSHTFNTPSIPWTKYSNSEFLVPSKYFNDGTESKLSFSTVIETEYKWQDCLGIYTVSDIREATHYFPLSDSAHTNYIESLETKYNRKIINLISGASRDSTTINISFAELFHLVDASSALQ
jgi:hypothetical protein|tara:strand:- start:2044 stop:3498 length:1455 start_codon:yes stop_codon:yes gene_type:complete